MKIGGFRISPPDPLETTKGRAAALPLETIPGLRGIPEDGRGRFAVRGYGGRWDGGRKMEALVPAVIPGPCLVEDEGNDSLVDLNQHWVFVAFGPCRGGALSPPALLGLMGISIKSVGADLCVGPWRVPRRGVSGRTHRSAPTRCGKRSGDNGNWHGKRTFPLRGGTEPAPLQKNGSKLAHGGVRLGCGFPQPNSETEFGASVMVTPPYGCVTGSAQQRADVGIGPYALRRTARRGRRALRVVAESRRDCPGQRRTAERLCQRVRGNGWELQQRSSPKYPATLDNPSVTAKP